VGGAPRPRRLAGRAAPRKPLALLTFDDGLIDHYRYAFPELRARGISGAFYPAARPTLERDPLDVHLIHHILAVHDDSAALVAEMEAQIDAEHRADGGAGVRSVAEYRASNFCGSRFDPPEVVYVKRMLQYVLPAAARARIVDRLFRTHVTNDLRAFAEELYLSAEQLREMVDGGMHVGLHGYDHVWLGELTPGDQDRDVRRSLALVDAIGLSRDALTYSYPYGSYDDHTLALMRAIGCAAAVTTRVGIAAPGRDDLLRLPRLDTNDLPKDAAAPAGEWTRAAAALLEAAPRVA
jgi:peptidoglycan/xylan/chitin deacetylase (PgdA/CDA1 family)